MSKSTQEIDKTKPVSLLHSIAEHYLHDAHDFACRFDLLWEVMLNKTGRIKSFIDLLFACECILKCHVFLSRVGEDPKVIFQDIRRASHCIGTLVKLATFMEDRTHYDELATRLAGLSVFLRYSFDAYESFFPSYVERNAARLNYSRTIGNNVWVLETRASIEPLFDTANNALSGFVTDDIAVILKNEHLIKELMDGLRK